MLGTKDLTLVIMFAVLSFIAWATLGQLPVLFFGIRGMAYAYIILFAIPQAVALMFFEGRRWRFFLMHTIFAFLSLPTSMGGAPFDLVFRLPIILTGLVSDIVVTTFYKMAKKQNRLRMWSILGNAFRWGIDPFFAVFILDFYSPADVVAIYLPIYIMLLPLVLVQGSFAGYFGYKIYNRVKKLNQSKKV